MTNEHLLISRIDRLIEMADALRKTHHASSTTYETTPTLSRSLFTRWQGQCLALLRSAVGEDHTYTEMFRTSVKKAHFYDVDNGQGVLTALKEDFVSGSLQIEQAKNPLEKVILICSRFHLIASQLRNRYAQREPLSIQDEYDAQYLLHSLLHLFFEDIRPEEWTPSYAGKSSRMDFLLKEEQIVVEVKRTRPTLQAKDIGTQLIDDIARYKAHHDCRVLVCFVYDPEGYVANPRGVERDLSRQEQGFEVKVIIAPKQY